MGEYSNYLKGLDFFVEISDTENVGKGDGRMKSTEEKMRSLLERLSGEMQVADSLGANVTHKWLESRIVRINKCLHTEDSGEE